MIFFLYTKDERREKTMIIAFVGCGGKTTTIKRYAHYYYQQGLKVLVTTSTHMGIQPQTDLSDDPQLIIEKLKNQRLVYAGRQENEYKMQRLSLETYNAVCQEADVVLIEADGSKQMPLKFPLEYEPVIDDNVDTIVILWGLSALGKRAYQVCHRLEKVKECLKIDDKTIMTAQYIQKLLNIGYIERLQREYPQCRIFPFPSQVKTFYQKVIARFLIEQKDISIIQEEWFLAKPHLMICGAGHVAFALAHLATFLGFDVTVIDDRQELMTTERFENQHIICDTYDHLDKYLIDQGYYVVLTKSLEDNYICLRTILKHSYTYVGMMSSHHKLHKIYDYLLEDGLTLEQIQTIHAPIGIDINVQTPMEIAVSIIGEIIHEKNNHYAYYLSKDLLECQEDGTLCIIIDKKGIAPRDKGSMMLVCQDKVIDSIGGGYMESIIVNDARKIMMIQEKEYLVHPQHQESGSIKILFVPIHQDYFVDFMNKEIES